MFLILYNIFLYIFKLSLPIFFSDIEVVGKSNVPPSGPVIIIGNHPNELLDVLVIGSTCGRPLSYWAKSTLFKNPIVGAFLRAVGAIPVQRKMDTQANPNVSPNSRMDNKVLEQETYKGFAEGRAMCVFPEGTSHSESHILHLKDGTSWTKFEYFDKYDGKKDVPIIPCGITYINKQRWRSQVVVQYGKPITLTEEQLKAFRENPKQSVKKLTEQMEQILYSLTLNAPDWTTMKLSHTVRRIYMGDTPLSLAEYVEVTRRFAHFYGASHDDPAVNLLKEDVAKYQERLDQLHLKDSYVRSGFSFWKGLKRLINSLFYILIFLPLLIPGMLLNFPIMMLGYLINKTTLEQESRATVKFLSALFFVPTLYTTFSLLLWYFFSLPFIVCMIVLPIIGTIHLRVLEEEAISIRTIWNSLRSVGSVVINSAPAELRALKKMRSDLEERITAMVDKRATPEQRTLEIKEKVSIAPTKKIMPVRRTNSYSESFL